MTFTVSPAPQPPNLSLRAKLSWKYFFEAGWAVVKTQDGAIICTDEGCDLTTATVFPDEESMVSWLETVCTEHLNDDPVTFLRCFVSVPELVTENVAREIMKALE